MAGPSRGKRFLERAASLRDACALRDVHLVAGEAEEILEAGIRESANMMGVAERYFLDRYVTDQYIESLADSLGQAGAVHEEAMATNDPVSLPEHDLGRVVAALGMVLKLAAQEMEVEPNRVDALGLTTDLADAVTGAGVALRDSRPGQLAELDGRTVVYIRKVLRRAIDNLREQRWICSCSDQHAPGASCTLQDHLRTDLGRVGGW